MHVTPWLVLAQQPAADPPFWISMMPIFLMLLAAYFLLLRPAQRQEKQRQALLANLKKNDKVVTQGGLIGIVAAVKDKEDEVTLKVDESSNVRLRVTRSSIVRIIGPEEAAKETREGGA